MLFLWIAHEFYSFATIVQIDVKFEKNKNALGLRIWKHDASVNYKNRNLT
jgi:hypothetical protein